MMGATWCPCLSVPMRIGCMWVLANQTDHVLSQRILPAQWRRTLLTPAALLEYKLHCCRCCLQARMIHPSVRRMSPGLQIGSEAGFERFVAGCAAALKRRRRRRHFMGLQNSSTTSTLPTARPTLSVTVYAPKLVYKDFGPYNLRALSELADQIFVMGYDMAPLGVKVGDGWKQVGGAGAGHGGGYGGGG